MAKNETAEDCIFCGRAAHKGLCLPDEPAPRVTPQRRRVQRAKATVRPAPAKPLDLEDEPPQPRFVLPRRESIDEMRNAVRLIHEILGIAPESIIENPGYFDPITVRAARWKHRVAQKKRGMGVK